jgi:hypothetical protein
MKDTYTFGELGFVFAITFLVGFFEACQLMQWYQVDPLKKTAIQKGYATYTIPNTNEPTLSVFTWK